MDVLIVEMDDLIAATLVEALAHDDIMAEVVPGENEAMAKCHEDCPKVVVTSDNGRLLLPIEQAWVPVTSAAMPQPRHTFAPSSIDPPCIQKF